MSLSRSVRRVRAQHPARGSTTRRVLAPYAAGAVVALVLLSVQPAGSSFTGATGTFDSSVAADTLDPPTGLAGTDGVTIELDWTSTVDAYADGYKILRSATPGGPYTEIADVGPQSAASYTDAAPEGRHYYVARSYHGTWQSPATAETTARAWRPFTCPSDPDLRACIQFDTDVSGKYLDQSSYGNDVLHSNGAQVEGISDQAADGSAAARYEVVDSASLDITNALTMEFWLRLDSLPSSGRYGLIDNDGQYSVFVYAGSGLRCSNGVHNLPNQPVSTGTWFHVACEWDGSTLTLYIDGSSVASMSSSGTPGTSNTDPMSLLDSSPGFNEPLDGAMDNLRIWASGRSQAEICADAGLTC